MSYTLNYVDSLCMNNQYQYRGDQTNSGGNSKYEPQKPCEDNRLLCGRMWSFYKVLKCRLIRLSFVYILILLLKLYASLVWYLIVLISKNSLTILGIYLYANMLTMAICNSGFMQMMLNKSILWVGELVWISFQELRKGQKIIIHISSKLPYSQA